MSDIVVCGLKRCRKSFKSRFRLKIHMLIKHHTISECYYIADIPLIICKNPKHCKYFYPRTSNKVNFYLSKANLNLLIEKDTYILSHMHNTQFKNHLLVILIGQECFLPEGPFLKMFEGKGTILKIKVEIDDLIYLNEDFGNNILEFDKKEENLCVSLDLIPEND